MARERLPDRRAATTISFTHVGTHFEATIGRFEDGRPAEVFLTTHKAGTPQAIAVADQAILVSIALQHGVALDTLRHALSREENGSPAGPLLALLDIVAAEGPGP